MMNGRRHLRKPALAIALLAAVLVAVASIALLYANSAEAASSTYQDYDSTNNNAAINITFPQGDDSFADTAGSLTRPGTVTNGTTDSALGPPNAPAPPANADATSVSLGDGGVIIVRFTNNVLTGSGNANPDVHIFEAGSIVETVDVYVAPGSVTGACPTTASDYTLVGRTTTSTGSLDIDDNGFGVSSRLHCVRIVDVAADQPNGGATAGAEIDAVGAIETVLYNDAPVNTVPGAQTTTENTSRVFNATNANAISIADSDAGTNPVRTTLTATNGTLTPGPTTTSVSVTGSGTNTLTLTGTVANINTALSGLTFRPNTNFAGTASLQVTTNDQGNTVEGPNRQASDTVAREDTDTVGITVTDANSVPVITTSASPLAYLPGDAATPVDPSATVTDSDSTNFRDGTLTVEYSAGGTADDRLAIRNQGTAAGQISVNTTTRVVSYGGTPIATYLATSNGTGTTPLVIRLDRAAATPAAVQALVRNITYQNLNPNPSGTRTVRFVVDDGDGGAVLANSDPAFRQINIGTIPPTISDVTDKTTNEDAATPAISFTVGDQDDGAASLTMSGSSSNTALVPNGNITFGGSGTNRTVTIRPAPDQSGTATITLTVTDPDGATTTDTFVLTVNAVNDAPQPANDSKTTDEDNPLTFPASDLTANDSPGPNESGQSLSVTGVGGATNGTVSLSGGQVTYTPNANYNGPATFNYTVCDNGSPQQCAQGTANVTVNAVNDAPVSKDDSYTTNEDNALNISAPGVLTNDADAEGNTLTASRVTGPTNGTLTLNSNGSFTYTPNANFNGTDSFTYRTNDGTTNSNTATVNIAVNAVNDPPNAQNDAATTDEDTATSINVKANDSDPDTGQTLSVKSVSDPSRGAATINADGTIRYAPNADFNGADTFTYTICDDASTPACSTATVTMTVNPVNDAPTISDVTDRSTDEDTPLAGIPFTVGDAETPAGDLTVTATSDNQTLVPNGNITLGGSGANRTVGLSPAPDRNGTATITLTVRDGSGVERTDTFVVTVNAINDDPIAGNDPAATDEDNAVVVDVRGNDSPGPNEGSQTLTTDSITRQPANGTAQILSGGPDAGKVRYTPNANFNGSDSFEYRICDNGSPQACATATANVTVRSVNDQPDATNDTVTTDEDTPLNISVRANDTDVDGDSLPISNVSNPANGTATVNSDGTIRYAPDQDFAGTETFTYTVSDGKGGTDTATVTVNVTPVNDAPVNGVSGSQSVEEDRPLTFSAADDNLLSISDADAGSGQVEVRLSALDGALTLSRTTGLTFSSGDGVNDASMTFTGTVSDANAALDGLRFAPGADYSGPASVEISTSDLGNSGSGGAKSDTDTVNITVNPTNDAPVAAEDRRVIAEDQTLNIPASELTQNDLAGPNEGNQSLTVTEVGNASNGSVRLEGDRVIFTPEADFFGEGRFEYNISDGEGGTGTATVVVDVTPINDLPRADDDTATTDEDQPVNVNVLDGDAPGPENESDQSLRVAAISTSPAQGTTTINPDKTITYAPNPDYNGPDSFTYTICDDGSPTRCDRANVAVTVNGANDQPVAEPDVYEIDEDQTLAADGQNGNPQGVLSNDRDTDGDALTVVDADPDAPGVQPVSGPSSGTLNLNADGTFVYDPSPGFGGQDTFTYRISDGNGGTTTATATISSEPINDLPEADDDSYSTDEDTPLNVNAPGILEGDADGDNDALKVEDADPSADGVQPVSGVRHGTLTLRDDGSFDYAPRVDFNGTDTFTYRMNDGNGATDEATVTINVQPVNDEPIARADRRTIPEDQTLNIPASELTSNDSAGPVGTEGNQSLTVTRVFDPRNGAVDLQNGRVIFTPDENYFGEARFSYEVCDDGKPQECAVSTMNIVDVTPVNDLPIADDDTATTDEDQPVTINVLEGDTTGPENEDDQSLRVVETTDPPANGDARINSDDTITYTPDPGFNGTDSFEYRACDSGEPSRCNLATVTVNVSAVNDAPKNSVPGPQTTDEDTPLVFGAANGNALTISDADAGDGEVTTTLAATGGVIELDGQNVSAGLTASGGGTNTLELTGTLENVNAALEGLRFVPDRDTNGDASLRISTSDRGNTGSGGALTDEDTLAITVRPVNDAPSAADDTASTNEDTAVGVSVLANDNDLDRDTLAVTNVSDPANGAAKINADGTLSYTPNANFNGSDSFTYTVSDGKGGMDTATVTMTVNPVNDRPSVSQLSDKTVDEDGSTGPIPFTIGDIETSAENLTVTATSSDQALIPNSNVQLGGSGANRTVTVTPAPNQSGRTMITVTVRDAQGSFDRDTFYVTVNPVNDAPTVSNIADQSTDEDTATSAIPFTIGDAETVAGDLAVSAASDDQGLVPDGKIQIEGSGAERTLRITPEPNRSGTATITLTTRDGGGTTTTETFTLTVRAVNDAPDATDDSAAATEDTSLDIPVKGNDTDADRDELTITGVSDPDNGAAEISNGTIRYTPDANFNGSDSFTYTVSDGNGGTDTATVTVNVAPINDAPAASDDSYNVDEDGTLNVDAPGVLAGDTDAEGDTLTATLASAPSNGTLALNGDGSFTYKPNKDYNGSDSFTYRASDGTTDGDLATVNISVAAVNDAPVAAADTAGTGEDQSANIDILSNDTDAENDSLSVTEFTRPQNGTVSRNSDGTLVYNPNANYNGVDTFEYTVSDGNGGTDTATVTITVGAANDAPAASDDSYNVDEDGTLNVDAPGVLAGDTDAEGDTLTARLVRGPSSGTLNLDQSGSFTYTPNRDFNGSDYFIYQACDDGTPEICSEPATVNLTVNAANDAPVATDDTASTDEDTPVEVNVLDGDADAEGDSLAVTDFTQPQNGTVSLGSGGALTYEPNRNFNGTDTFEYTVADGNGGTTTGTATITVQPVNDAPSAEGETYSTDEDTALTVDAPGVLAGDTDLDGDALKALLEDGPQHGSLSLDQSGSFVYTPEKDFNGSDSFTYRASDGSASSVPVLVNITVNPVNDAPSAVNDSATTDEDAPVDISVLANDADTENDGLSVSGFTRPEHGTVDCTSAGVCTYTPNANYNGPDSFTYRASDGAKESNTAIVNLTVNAANDAPEAANNAYTVTEDDTLGVAAPGVIEGDTDLDGDRLSAEVLSGPSNGSLTLDQSGSFDYTPNANYSGPDSFTYQVSDDNGGTDAATVNIGVSAVNDAPVVGDDSANTDEDNSAVIDVKADDSAGPGEPDQTLEITSVTDPANGAAEVITGGPDAGKVRYTPDRDYNGSDSFTYTVCDSGKPGKCATATVSVRVAPINDRPVANDFTANTVEDSAMTVNAIENDTDADGNLDPASVRVVSGPANGSATANPDGTITYTPPADFNGTDSFTYVVCDTAGECSEPATVSMSVGAVNDSPSATDDEKATAEDTTLSFPASELAANDTPGPNEKEQSLLVTQVGGASGGRVSLEDGEIIFEPDRDYNGDASFTYSVCDDGDEPKCADGTVTVTITSVNDAPENTVPGSQSTDDTSALVFSEANGNAVSISDDSGAGGEARVTLSVEGGAISLGGTDGLSFTQGDGADDNSMTFTGSIAAVNAALEGLRYQPGGYNGAATFKITTDDLGNTGTGGPKTDEDEVAITVNDTTPPAAPTVDLAAPSDTGRSDTDDTTSDATPTITGTAEPNSTVKLYDGEELLAEITAGENGEWTFNLPDALTEGERRITATATDAAGNTSDSSEPLNITVDTSAPDTFIEQSPPNPTNQRDTVRFFSASEEGATFECSFDGGAYEPCDSPKDYNNLSDGEHTFRVRAVDAAGNTDESPAFRTFVVDTEKPDVTLSAPEEGALVRGEITLSARASDASGIRNVVFLVDGEWFDSDMSTPYEPTLDTASLPDGEHTITVRAYDEAGNLAESGPRTIRVDNTAPDTTITSSPSNPSNNPNAVFEFDSTEENSTFECSIDDGAYEPCEPGETYNDLSDGEHVFRVRAVDEAGNADASPAERRFKVDAREPGVPEITSPAEGATDNDGDFAVRGRAEPGSTVRLLENGNVVGTATADGNGDWSVNLSEVTDGSHAYTATATDAAGNASAESGSRGVNVDTGAPEVGGIVPARDATGVPTNTTIRAVVSEPIDENMLGGFFLTKESTGERVPASLRYDAATGEIVLTPDADLDFDSVYTATIIGSLNGVRDRAGNPLTQDTTWSFTTAQAPDARAPDAPTADLAAASDTGRSDTDDATGETTPTITGTAEPGSTVEVFVDGDPVGTARAGDNGEWTFTLTEALSEGAREITAAATDAAGNTSGRSEPLVITVDTSAPDTNITKSPSSPTNDTTASLEFASDEDGASFECRLDGGAWEPCESEEQYQNLSDGEHVFEVRATDAAGNTDESPASRTFVVDTEKPTAGVTMPPEGALVRGEITIGAEASDNVAVMRTEFVLDILVNGQVVDSDPSTPYETTFDTNNLPDGEHTITIRTYDEAGNFAESEPRTIRVDNTAPDTTVRRSPDDLTNDSAAVFEFDSTEENSTFECSIDDGAYEPCEPGETYNDLSDGEHVFRVRAVDEAGNADASPAERRFTIDAGAPSSPEILAPAADRIDNDGNFTVSGKAEPNSRVRLLENGNVVGEATADENGDWSVDLRNVTEGAHAYRATATDSAGNASSASGGRTVMIDSQAPGSPTVDLAAASDTGRSDTDDTTSDATPTITGTAEPGSTVRLYEGGTLLGTATTDENGDYTITLAAPLVEGARQITATATDAAGNVSNPSGARRIVVDRTVDTSIDGGSSGATASRSASFEFSSPETGASFECRLDDEAWKPCESGEQYDGLLNGNHVFRARATDKAGNVDNSPAERKFTVDATAPDAPRITSPASGARRDGNFTVSGKAEPNSRVRLLENGNAVGEVTANENGDWSVDLRGVSDGSHSYIARATDAVGNTSAASSTLGVRVDTTAPDTRITSGPSGRIERSTVLFEFDSTEEGASFECRMDDGEWQPCGGLSREYQGLSEGEHVFRVRATDAVGNVDESPAIQRFTVRAPRADLSVRVRAPERITQGKNFAYTLTARNRGPDAARSVVLESRLPGGMSFVSAPEGCEFSERTRTVTCRLGDIGADGTRKIKVFVKAERSGGFGFQSVISSATSDPRPDNSRATGSVSVAKKPEPPRANLAIRVDSPERITKGKRFRYTIRVANLGPDRAESAVVKSVLPRSVSFVRAPEGCNYARGGRTLTCRIGDLPNGGRKQIAVTVRADRVGSAEFRASVESRTPDPVRSNDRDAD